MFAIVLSPVPDEIRFPCATWAGVRAGLEGWHGTERTWAAKRAMAAGYRITCCHGALKS